MGSRFVQSDPTTVSEEELRRAKALAKGRLELRLEDTQNAALWYGAQQLLTHKVLTVDEVEERIEADLLGIRVWRVL